MENIVQSFQSMELCMQGVPSKPLGGKAAAGANNDFMAAFIEAMGGSVNIEAGKTNKGENPKPSEKPKTEEEINSALMELLSGMFPQAFGGAFSLEASTLDTKQSLALGGKIDTGGIIPTGNYQKQILSLINSGESGFSSNSLPQLLQSLSSNTENDKLFSALKELLTQKQETFSGMQEKGGKTVEAAADTSLKSLESLERKTFAEAVNSGAVKVQVNTIGEKAANSGNSSVNMYNMMKNIPTVEGGAKITQIDSNTKEILAAALNGNKTSLDEASKTKESPIMLTLAENEGAKADKILAGKANKSESNGDSEAYQNNEDKTAEIGKNLGTAKKETFQEAPKLTVERDENTESKEESKIKPKAESLKSLDGAEGTSTKSITQNSFEALGESEKIPPEKQVERAVLKAVRENKDVLVMKLTPESLGEITVKISRMGERLTVNLTALNEQTQKLLQGAESELRLALKPLGNEIVVQTGGTSAQNDLTGFLNGQRQFGGYGENNQRQQRQSYYYQREGLEMSEAPTLEKQLESVLSMYA